MKRITYVGLAFALSTILLGSSAVAQTPASAPDQTPLGDYARKVQKNSAVAAKPKPKVFDNDNLPTNDKLSIVGAQPAANAGGATPADADKAAAEAKAASSEDDQAKKQAEWKSWKERLTAQKDSIDLASRELDVLQREYQLRAAAMYADAGNRLRNSGQWDKQESEYKQKIADKQKAAEDAKQKLDDMQEQARKAGVPSSMID
jgi:chromosome segregation ATPase